MNSLTFRHLLMKTRNHRGGHLQATIKLQLMIQSSPPTT